MIRIRDLKKSFGKLQVLRGISLEMHAGQVVALIGPNASGKTTLLKCILGMVVPDSGVIEFGGKPVNKEVSYRKHIGYMPQIGRYPENMRVRQVVNMMTDLYPNGADMDTELAEAFYLQEMDQKFMRTLSGGSRQRSVLYWHSCLMYLCSFWTNQPLAWILYLQKCSGKNTS